MLSPLGFGVVMLTAAGLITISLTLYAWRHRTTPGGKAFLVLTLAAAVWSLGYLAELIAPTVEGKVFWGKVQYFGIVLVPYGWLTLSLQITDQGRWFRPRWHGLLLFVPVVTVLLVWTTERHGLVWETISLDSSGPFPALSFTYGLFFWVNWISAQAQLLVGTVLLIRRLWRLPHLYRWQIGLLVTASLAPWMGNLAYIFKLMPIPNLDPTPFGFAVSALFQAWSIFRYRFLDIRPVARKAVVDGLGDAVIVLDPAQRIVDLNPAAEALLDGGTELIGRLDESVLEHWPELMALGRAPQIGERLWQSSDGRWLLARSTELFDDRHPAGRLLVVRDVTAQRQGEQALAAARDRAIEASELKGQILAKVSHELRTPLGAILGYTELLESGAYGDLSERQRSATQRVIQSTHFLTRLVNELLEQAQSESGRLQVSVESTRPIDLVEAIRQQFAVTAAHKGLELEVALDPDLPSEVMSDSKRLLQIASNLVSNALKFTSRGGVTVRVETGPADHWRLTVSDTGAGIAPEHIGRIFEPFWQADGTLTREHGGYGLGLAITQQLVQLLGGRIEVSSSVGQGTTFVVTLPLVVAHPVETAQTILAS